MLKNIRSVFLSIMCFFLANNITAYSSLATEHSLNEAHEMKLGSIAPHLNLLDTTTNKHLSLEDIKSSKGTVVMFICNHCPYVVHVCPQIVQLSKDYKKRGISFVAISSNDTEKYPEDGPDKMAEFAKLNQFNFPYLFDETQGIAKAYNALCTPDFLIFDGDLKCVYHGQLDESRPDSGIPLTGKDLRLALDCLLEAKPIIAVQKPSVGCSIKWKE